MCGLNRVVNRVLLSFTTIWHDSFCSVLWTIFWRSSICIFHLVNIFEFGVYSVSTPTLYFPPFFLLLRSIRAIPYGFPKQSYTSFRFLLYPCRYLRGRYKCDWCSLGLAERGRYSSCVL